MSFYLTSIGNEKMIVTHNSLDIDWYAGDLDIVSVTPVNCKKNNIQLQEFGIEELRVKKENKHDLYYLIARSKNRLDELKNVDINGVNLKFVKFSDTYYKQFLFYSDKNKILKI